MRQGRPRIASHIYNFMNSLIKFSCLEPASGKTKTIGDKKSGRLRRDVESNRRRIPSAFVDVARRSIALLRHDADVDVDVASLIADSSNEVHDKRKMV
jgi:hypothetical protein